MDWYFGFIADYLHCGHYLFYFLVTNRNLINDLEKELSFVSVSIREDIIFLLKEFVGIMVAFFRGQLLIGMIMGVGFAIGFSLSGLKFGITLGLIFGLLNVVPYLGSIIGISTVLVCLILVGVDGGGLDRVQNYLWYSTTYRKLF